MKHLVVATTTLPRVFCLETWPGEHMKDHTHHHKSTADSQCRYYARLMLRRGFLRPKVQDKNVCN